jgi:SP family arabinose:H+ symporter-like MFS transporter
METQVENKHSYIKSVMLIVLVTAVGGFTFGYDNAAISGSIGFLEAKFNLPPSLVGWVISSIIVGCIIGVVCSGKLSDKIGRKKTLLVTGMLFVIGALGQGLASNVTMLIIARLLVGMGIGMETTIAPLYIAEISPAQIRGRLVSFNQLFNTIGNLVVFMVSAAIAYANTPAWNVESGWRYILGSGIVPGGLFFILLFIVPESPRWLVKNKKEKEAMKVLEKINLPENVEIEYQDIKKSIASEFEVNYKVLLQPSLRKALTVGILVALFQQITGINAIIYYAPEIFKSAGLGSNSAMLSTVIMGVIMVVSTVVSMWIIDKVGRRTLLIYGSLTMTVLLAVVGYLFNIASSNSILLIVCILVYVAAFSVSFGTVTFVIISEIFPFEVRGVAASISTFALWGGNLVVSSVFPILISKFGSSITFYIFGVISLLSLLFVLKFVPETKGKSLEQITADLSAK